MTLAVSLPRLTEKLNAGIAIPYLPADVEAMVDAAWDDFREDQVPGDGTLELMLTEDRQYEAAVGGEHTDAQRDAILSQWAGCLAGARRGYDLLLARAFEGR